MENKFKIGDKVRCIPGFKNCRDDYPDGGGAGYKENLEFIIDKRWGSIERYPEKGCIYSGKETMDGYGVYEFALELVEELKLNINEISIF